MVTLFTTPRPFEGLYGIIQINALTSWSLTQPKPHKVVMYADKMHEGEEPIALAEELGFEVWPIMRRTQRGVPLVSEMFQGIREANEIPCYVNADIIIGDGLTTRVEEAASGFESCLIISRRWNVQMLNLMKFNDGWFDELWEKVQDQGSLMASCAIDLFAWKGEVWSSIPDFAIGRYAWDNWLVGKAMANHVPIIDITPVVKLVHQSHNIVKWEDPDAQSNFRKATIMGDLQHSSHTLTEDGIVDGWVR